MSQRIAFRDSWMKLGEKHQIKLICRSLLKKSYATWLASTFGQGVLINPHVAAFAIVARCVDNYLASLPHKPRGILISDDNKEVVSDIEKSINVLRGTTGTMRLNQIVEKGFFVDSAKSFVLQLCDLFAMSLRKQAERIRRTSPAKSFDDSGIAIAESLIHHDNHHDADVIKWLTEQHQAKKEAARA